MNIGIIGFPQTGKKTLFELLTGARTDVRPDANKVVRGVADVLDPRFDKLVQLYGPKKESRARMEIVLPPRIEERSVSQGDIFKDLAEVERRVEQRAARIPPWIGGDVGCPMHSATPT